MAEGLCAHGPLFSKLAPELRNAIYSYVLTSKEEIRLNVESMCKAMALLRTSKQVHQEAEQMFYASNTFVIELKEVADAGIPGNEMIQACRLLMVAGAVNMQSISRLIVRFQASNGATTAEGRGLGSSRYGKVDNTIADYANLLLRTGIDKGQVKIEGVASQKFKDAWEVVCKRQWGVKFLSFN